jgi:hypothetical protein
MGKVTHKRMKKNRKKPEPTKKQKLKKQRESYWQGSRFRNEAIVGHMIAKSYEMKKVKT